ncbi:MAG: glycosyl hydrolase, partial [Candidatus Promineifilaceae bacterium]
RFADTAAQIASHYQSLGLGGQVAYEIWNEGDIHGQSSIYLKPQHMAVILRRAATAIRQAAPGAKIIFGGMASGAESAVSYLNQCKLALGGPLPIDAVGIHPYGRYVGDPPFEGFGFGQLADPLRFYRQNLPGMSFWITEIGIAEDTELGPQYYETIAQYMQKIYTYVAGNHARYVPVVIWFAWSDEMRNAGMVDRNGNPKAHIYEVFEAVRDREIL